MAIVQNPFQQWNDPLKGGRVIFSAKIYVGQPDTDPTVPANQLQVFYIDENEQQINLAQPLTTNSGGFVVISETNSTIIQPRVTESNYSITVQNKQGVNQWVIPNSSEFQLSINHNDTLDRNNSSAHESSAITLSQGGSVQDSIKYVTPEMFGPVSTPTERTASLDLAIKSNNPVLMTDGVYAPYNMTDNDLQIKTEGKPTFTIAPNTVEPTDTVPISALTISGNNITIEGDIYTNGNSATNDSSGYNLSNRRGELHIAGADFSLKGTIYTTDAHYVGVSLGNETDFAERTYIERIVNIESQSYIFSAWNCLEWSVGGILNRDAVQDFDNRVYTGNQSSSSKTCSRGEIGYIIGRGTYGVFEINTVGLSVGYMDIAGWKSEGTTDFNVQTARSAGVASTFDVWGFGVIQSTNFTAGVISVDNYQGLQPRAVQISSSTGSISSLSVDNNSASVSCEIFSVPDGFEIDSMSLNGRSGTATGLRLPSGQTRVNLVIKSLNSRGHTISDADIATVDFDNIKLLNVNKDINISSGYESVKNRNDYNEGVDAVQMTATTGTITLTSDNDLLSFTQNGRDLTLKGRLVVSSVSSPTGSLRITGLNDPPSDLPEASGEVPVTIQVESLTGSPAGIIQAKIPEGSTDIIVTRYNNGAAVDDVAQYIQGGSRITLSATYSVS